MFLHYTMVFRTAYIFQNLLNSQKEGRQLIWEVACKKQQRVRLNVSFDIYNYCINFEDDLISYSFFEMNVFQNHHSQ